MTAKRSFIVLTLVCGILFFPGCRTEKRADIRNAGHTPLVEPDYIGVTIPPNIAPMNFMIREDGISYRVTATSPGGHLIRIRASNGKIRFPARRWKKLLEESRGDKITITVYASDGRKGFTQYDPFYMHVADDPVDPYLAYRLIHPGYYSWSNIKIVQRSVESFRVKSVIENQVIEKNCANCHSFNSNSPDRFMIHIRGSLGGTYFAEDGRITKADPKIDGMPGGATYPAWHPGGRFLAFSSNQVRQSFYSIPEKSIEVFDLVSSLILYDREKNETINITDSDPDEYLQTFPSWSPDGKHLYFCRASQYESGYNPEMEEIMNTRYDLARKSFDPFSRTFGDTEIIFRASEIMKSASFPRVSPVGRYLVFTLADYGTFPVWHREADLYLLDLTTGEARRMDINSPETESYHTWSNNGRWIVFSSRRTDGRSSRPFIAYIDPKGNQGREFILPQKDPAFYDKMLESFNIPEFVNGQIKLRPRDFAAASKQDILRAQPGGDATPEQLRNEKKIKAAIEDNVRPIHE
ncbi:MAG: hypothetical protein K0B05_02595 [Bacteroidales bacterium]|nr:hypothetical protein [Bacteroidales bacterium]